MSWSMVLWGTVTPQTQLQSARPLLRVSQPEVRPHSITRRGYTHTLAGGTLLFPAPGRFLTGSFDIPSYTTVWIDTAAEIIGTLACRGDVELFCAGTTNASEYVLVDALPSYPIESRSTM